MKKNYQVAIELTSKKLERKYFSFNVRGARDAWKVFYQLSKKMDDVVLFDDDSNCIAIRCGNSAWTRGVNGKVSNLDEGFVGKRHDLFYSKFNSISQATLPVLDWLLNDYR